MFEVVGALVMIGLQQPLLALVSFALTPALSRALRAVVVRSSAIIYKRQQLASSALQYAAERLGQVQTVQAFAAEAREAAAFSHLSHGGYELAERYAFFQVAQDFWMMGGAWKGGREGGQTGCLPAAPGRRLLHAGFIRCAHSASDPIAHHCCEGRCGRRGPPGGECGHSGVAGFWWCACHPWPNFSGKPAGRCGPARSGLPMCSDLES